MEMTEDDRRLKVVKGDKHCDRGPITKQSCSDLFSGFPFSFLHSDFIDFFPDNKQENNTINKQLQHVCDLELREIFLSILDNCKASSRLIELVFSIVIE